MIMIPIIMLLIIRAEEQHKLVTASLNFYKTAEQVPTLPTISFPSLSSTSSYHKLPTIITVTIITMIM